MKEIKFSKKVYQAIEDLNNLEYFKNFQVELQYIEEDNLIGLEVSQTNKNLKLHSIHLKIIEGFIRAFFEEYESLKDEYFRIFLNFINIINLNDYEMDNNNIEEEIYSIFPNLPYDQLNSTI